MKACIVVASSSLLMLLLLSSNNIILNNAIIITITCFYVCKCMYVVNFGAFLFINFYTKTAFYATIIIIMSVYGTYLLIVA